jgi:hypothetical protein
MSLFIYEAQGPTQDPVRLDPDQQQQVRAQTNKLTASFSLSGISSTEVEGNLTWLLDGKKQAFDVTEPIRGVFDADLSKFDWQDNQSYTLRVSFNDETSGQEHFVEQAILYAEPPKPIPPKPKNLPQAAIVSPDLLTVLYDQLQEREIPIMVNLRAADENPIEPGQLTFEINGKPAQKAGQPLVHEFDEKLTAIKDTLPLVDGENVIRARLKAADGRPDKLTESVVVYYRRPPRVKTVTAKADAQFPRAEITCEFQTPLDRPPVDYQIFVNNKLFSVDKDQTTQTQDIADKTLWTVTAKDVPLSEGSNAILFYPRNTDARSLSTLKVEREWTKPVAVAAPLPSRPEIYFSNADDQIPIAGHWRGDDFTVAFNVLAGGKLKKLFVYYNKKRLDSPAIPEPKDGSKYEFMVEHDIFVSLANRPAVNSILFTYSAKTSPKCSFI